MDRREFLQTGACTAADMLLPSSSIAAHAKESARGTEIHVALTGDDAAPGTEKAPFATLERARQEILARKKPLSSPVTVWVHGGTYYLEQPLVFGPEDSGTADAPITFSSYQHQLVTISGGRKLNCRWQPYRDSILQCFLPEVERNRLNFTQLFVGGKRQIRARYPSYDSKTPWWAETVTSMLQTRVSPGPIRNFILTRQPSPAEDGAIRRKLLCIFFRWIIGATCSGKSRASIGATTQSSLVGAASNLTSSYLEKLQRASEKADFTTKDISPGSSWKMYSRN